MNKADHDPKHANPFGFRLVNGKPVNIVPTMAELYGKPNRVTRKASDKLRRVQGVCGK